MRWAEIKAIVCEESVDLIANIMIEEGCGGVAITGPSVRASGPPELVKDVPVEKHTTITGYLPVDDRLEGKLYNIRYRVRSLPETGVDIGPGDINVKPIDDADWAGAWKSFFKPIEVGRVFIKPSWEDVKTRPEQVIVEIDPGMAFGTGNHPTTQLCLKALQEYIEGGERVLDIGSGSGILAIAAAKLGAAEVVAVENDPVAVKSAEENIRRNNISSIVKMIEADSPTAASGQFDIIVANITANVIISMTSGLAESARPGGLLIVSGLIEEREAEVTSALTRAGFEKSKMGLEDEWVALIMQRRWGQPERSGH